jgi:hypothetical protein
VNLGGGGAGGDPSGAEAGTPSGAEAGAQSGGGGSSACEEGATGTVEVTIMGLPDGAMPVVVATGPEGEEPLEDGLSWEEAPSGSYEIMAERFQGKMNQSLSMLHAVQRERAWMRAFTCLR